MMKLKNRIVKRSLAVSAPAAFVGNSACFSLFEPLVCVLVMTLLAIAMTPVFRFTEVKFFFRFIYLAS
jgi:hypothetical protein